jgi:RimJ/RimL family protein N-acetyltransferase
MLNPATVRRRRHRGVLRHLRLPDGVQISLRPVRSEDADEFARAYIRLSPTSRQRRFHSVTPVLPPAELRYLTSVDQDEHVALVAIGPDGGEILGSARYIRLPGRPGVAEMAIEVIDEWQRRGVGQRLLEALGARAQANGVDRFVAIVAPENAPMQHVMRQAGATLEVVDGELEYLVEVSALTRGASTVTRDEKPDGRQATRSSPAPATRFGTLGAAPSPA